MKFYVAHSSGYDYKTELYEPLKAAFASEHEMFFPHDTEAQGVKSKDIIPKCNAVLAEVSFPSTGQGIELGWAAATGVPIICFFRAGSSPSSALRFVSDNMVEYSSPEDMVAKIRFEAKRLVV